MSDSIPSDSNSTNENGEWQDPAVTRKAEENEDRSTEERSVIQKVFIFFLPLIILGGCVLLFFLGMNWLFYSSHTDQNLLTKLHTGAKKEQWYAIYRLSNRIHNNPKKYRNDARLKLRLLQIYRDVSPENTKLQKSLVDVLGTLRVQEAAEPLQQTLKKTSDERLKVTILQVLGQIQATSALTVLEKYATHQRDPGYRQAAIASLGKLPSKKAIPPLQNALTDSIPHVRWNAALGLANHQRPDKALPILKKMLDRNYVQNQKQPDQTGKMVEMNKKDTSRILIAALSAVRALKDKSLIDKIRDLSNQDPDTEVRRAARETLKVLTTQ